jgi:hypothetical protein
MNVEHRSPTSNVKWEKMKKKTINIAGRHVAQAPALRERHHYSMFNVGSSMFDVYFLVRLPPG